MRTYTREGSRGDFKEMAEGDRLVGEMGGGGPALPDEVLPMVDWARKYKMLVSVHYGPRLIPGATTMLDGKHNFTLSGGGVSSRKRPTLLVALSRRKI